MWVTPPLWWPPSASHSSERRDGKTLFSDLAPAAKVEGTRMELP